jgi:hypothetical protein
LGKNPWVVSLESLLTLEKYSLTGPLMYLSVSHDETVKDYQKLLDTQISEEFRDNESKLMKLVLSDLALAVFEPNHG